MFERPVTYWSESFNVSLQASGWMMHLTTQVQRAIFIVESAPVYPDMLAMLNSMALLASQKADNTPNAPNENMKEPEQTTNTST